MNHTRIIHLLVTLLNLKFVPTPPKNVANFRFGSLVGHEAMAIHRIPTGRTEVAGIAFHLPDAAADGA